MSPVKTMGTLTLKRKQSDILPWDTIDEDT